VTKSFIRETHAVRAVIAGHPSLRNEAGGQGDEPGVRLLSKGLGGAGAVPEGQETLGEPVLRPGRLSVKLSPFFEHEIGSVVVVDLGRAQAGEGQRVVEPSCPDQAPGDGIRNGLAYLELGL
jgi:hypothetical protein